MNTVSKDRRLRGNKKLQAGNNRNKAGAAAGFGKN
jgi:hypothetical protein